MLSLKAGSQYWYNHGNIEKRKSSERGFSMGSAFRCFFCYQMRIPFWMIFRRESFYEDELEEKGCL